MSIELFICMFGSHLVRYAVNTIEAGYFMHRNNVHNMTLHTISLIIMIIQTNNNCMSCICVQFLPLYIHTHTSPPAGV